VDVLHVASRGEGRHSEEGEKPREAKTQRQDEYLQEEHSGESERAGKCNMVAGRRQQ